MARHRGHKIRTANLSRLWLRRRPHDVNLIILRVLEVEPGTLHLGYAGRFLPRGRQLLIHRVCGLPRAYISCFVPRSRPGYTLPSRKPQSAKYNHSAYNLYCLSRRKNYQRPLPHVVDGDSIVREEARNGGAPADTGAVEIRIESISTHNSLFFTVQRIPAEILCEIFRWRLPAIDLYHTVVTAPCISRTSARQGGSQLAAFHISGRTSKSTQFMLGVVHSPDVILSPPSKLNLSCPPIIH
ncbi:hypothetical protein DFH08DRAFT_814850 [Mycena albidolilacea]|uniref:Uncharacterized protein n=1 Tax=Mycena albidolilacea TaxID=1033008 RepID=A0AAD6ZNZ3_9AGAR|nr:hypothetical protein DFH08DRAFT_814850 [Mycena albidolilacea]